MFVNSCEMVEQVSGGNADRRSQPSKERDPPPPPPTNLADPTQERELRPHVMNAVSELVGELDICGSRHFTWLQFV